MHRLKAKSMSGRNWCSERILADRVDSQFHANRVAACISQRLPEVNRLLSRSMAAIALRSSRVCVGSARWRQAMGLSFGPFVSMSRRLQGKAASCRRGTMLPNQMRPSCMRSHVQEATLDAGVVGVILSCCWCQSNVECWLDTTMLGPLPKDLPVTLTAIVPMS